MSPFKRFPSYDQVIQSAIESFLRFPLALLCGLCASVCLAILIEQDFGETGRELERVLMASGLGISWFVALTLWGEKRRWSTGIRLGVQAAGLALLVVYMLSLPKNVSFPEAHLVRFAILAAGMHFLVACLPFLGRGEGAGFWQFNKTLLLRFLLAAFYSAVIFAGLAIALAAADNLFGADIDEETYGQLWACVVGLFNTWFFLAGIPKDLHALTDDSPYPVGLKVFTQFVLLPLVGLYFAILIAYEFKIIFEWNWPRGWVSELVLWYAVVGLLSMLLLHPQRERVENKWMKVFFAWYFRLLVPLIVMLFLAISVRISDYGITESRYLVMVMALGLAVVMLYFLFSKVKDIRVIPTILAVLAFLSAYGPWGAFAVSERSQLGRLEELMVTNELMADGRLLPHESETQPNDAPEMSNIVDYLCRRHGAAPFDKWFDDSVIVTLDTTFRYELPNRVCERLGFSYNPYAGYAGTGAYFHLTAELQPTLMVSGYDYLLEVTQVPATDARQTVELGDRSWEYWYDRETSTVHLEDITDSIPDAAALELSEGMSELLKHQSGYATVPADQLTFDLNGKTFKARLALKYLSGPLRDSMFHADSFSGQMLIGLEP